MARIRSIKPEFFTSETVSQLPLRTRLTWIGLWTHCDNYGRARDNVKLIKAAVWPLDEVGPKDIEVDLNTLADCGLIVRYVVGGKSFLAVTNWKEHQYGADKGEPKYPGPDQADTEPGPEKFGQDLNESGTNLDKSVPNQGSGVRGQDGKGQGGEDSDESSQPAPDGGGRKRDELFEAVAESANIDWHRLTPTARKSINAALKELRAVDATPNDVRARASQFRSKFPQASLTPMALAKHWPALTAQPAAAHVPGAVEWPT